MVVTVGGLLALLSVGCRIHDESSEAPRSPTVSRAAVEAEINRYVCAAWLDDVQMYEARFSDPRCAEASTSELNENAIRLIRGAIDDCAALVMLAETAYTRAYAQLEQPSPPSAAAADDVVRAAYWSDPHLGAIALSRAKQRLHEQGIECTDCPSAGIPEPDALSWAEFERYMSAYIWPEQVSETGETHLHVCSAANGVHELGLVGEQRLNAAFLAAVALASREPTHDRLAGAVDPQFTLAEARRAVAQLIASEDARLIACETLEAHAWYTGVTVHDCG